MAQVTQPHCPQCGGMTKRSFQVWQIIIAILFFPFGLVAFAIPRKWKCTSCGQWVNNITHTPPITPAMKQKNPVAANNTGRPIHHTTPIRYKNNNLMEKIKQTSAFEFFNKHKLWLIPSIIALCIVTVFVSSQVKKANYIKNEFAYAAQAQASEDYYSALNHIDNILKKDADNKQALTMKTELESLYKKQRIKSNLQYARIAKDKENYIDAYNYVISALDLDPDNTEALTLKDELLPLYQTQKKQLEEEQAAEKARQAAQREEDQKAKEKQEAEEKAREAEEKAKKESDAKEQQDALDKAQADLDKFNKAIEDTYNSVILDKTYYGNGYTIDYPSSYSVEFEDDFVIFTDPETNANISITDEVGGGNVRNIKKSDVESSLGITLTDFYMDNINGIDVCVYDYPFYGNKTSVFIFGASKNYMVMYQRPQDINAAKEIEMTKMLTTFNTK